MSKGFQIVQVDDLQSALDALDKTRYRYVVVDLSIPFSRRWPSLLLHWAASSSVIPD
jgi:DNA-binding response OmpR family regulator